MTDGAAFTHPARQFPRLRVHLRATLSYEGCSWTGSTTNLSLRGCQAHFPSADGGPAADTSASLALTFPSGTVTTFPVRVVNAAPRPEGLTVALEFARPDAALGAFLRLHLTAHARRESGEHRMPIRAAAGI